MLCRTIGMNMASALFPFTYGWFPKRALSTKCQTNSFDSLIPSEKKESPIACSCYWCRTPHHDKLPERRS